MNATEPTYYELLEVPSSASTDQIRAAYRQQVLRLHPDQGGNRALFQMVERAYQVLTDPQQRAAYDDDLHSTPPGGYQFPADLYSDPTRMHRSPFGGDDVPFQNNPAPHSGPTFISSAASPTSRPFGTLTNDDAIKRSWRLTRGLLVGVIVLWVIVALITPMPLIPGMNDNVIFWTAFWLLLAWLFLSVGLRFAAWAFAGFTVLDALFNAASPGLTAVRLVFCFVVWLVGHWIFTFKHGEYRSVMAASVLTKLPSVLRPDHRWLNRI